VRCVGRHLVVPLCKLVGRDEVKKIVECPIHRIRVGEGGVVVGVVRVVLAGGGGSIRQFWGCEWPHLPHTHHGQVCPTHQR
jgi:hypothetical protein